MENKTNNVCKLSFTDGLILGVIFLALNIITFYYVINVNTVWLITIGSFFITPVLGFFSTLLYISALRKSAGGHWNFKAAIKHIFVLLIIACSVCYAGKNFIFKKIIEPDMIPKIENSIITATSDFMSAHNMSQSQVDDKLSKIRKDFDDQKNPTLTKIFISLAEYFISIVLATVVLGLIYQKKPFVSFEDK